MSSTIFVVGAGPGIGSAVAQHFAAKGFSVGLIARSQRTLDTVAAEPGFKSQNIRVSTKTGDVTDYKGMDQALDSLKAELGSPNVVVYNVASTGLSPKPLDELTPEDLENHLKMSSVGALNVAHWAAKNLEAKEKDGKRMILFTGGGLYAYPAIPAWEGLACGKAALRNLSLGLHDHYKKSGIHVASVNVAGHVGAGDPKYNAPRIAEEYWKIYEEKGEWTQEILY